jgi:hypothetical protein
VPEDDGIVETCRYTMRFEMFKAVTLSMLVFWVLTPCGLVLVDTNVSEEHIASIFRAEYRGSMLILKAVFSYKSTRRYNLEDQYWRVTIVT